MKKLAFIVVLSINPARASTYTIKNNTPDTIDVRAEVGGAAVKKERTLSPGAIEKISFKGRICLSNLIAKTNRIKTENTKEYKWNAPDGKYKEGSAASSALLFSCGDHAINISLKKSDSETNNYKVDMKDIGEKIKEILEPVGKEIEKTAEKAGKKIKETFDPFAKALTDEQATKRAKEDLEYLGEQISESAKKTGRTIKEGFGEGTSKTVTGIIDITGKSKKTLEGAAEETKEAFQDFGKTITGKDTGEKIKEGFENIAQDTKKSAKKTWKKIKKLFS